MTEPAAPITPPAGKPPKEKKPLLWRTANVYHVLHLPPIRSRLGILLIVLIVAGFGSIITMVGLKAASYSESAAFCTKCHQMGPELRAYNTSAHSELPCADCHVNPGVGGWLKAKIKGTQQLIEVVTGTFPQPIPPPDHSEMPPVTATCLKCHSLASITKDGGPIRLVLRPTYEQNQTNTRQMVAVVLRPQGMTGTTDGTASEGTTGRGVHWHVQLKVTYLSADPRAQTIDFVTIQNADGTTESYVSAAAISMSGNVKPDIARLKTSDKQRTMDCLDCHNRAGHGNPTPSQAVDTAISTGLISESIPYIKKNGVDQLNAVYPTLEAADASIDGLQGWYAQNFPGFTDKNPALIAATLSQIKAIYAQLATPEMKQYANTYPDNLGHQSAPGCFRCHDGAHYKVANGAVTKETIPSTCSTCHTFPQVGGTVTDLLLGGKPSSHNDPLWVFNHKDASAAIASERNAQLLKLQGATVEPAGTSCGTCHQRNYCESCHKSGAIGISHNAMLFSHADVIRQVGGTTACATCHQPPQCARCHTGNVLNKPSTQVALYFK
jgi:nitrate/TMAO reductase-like tetraheme cytochrome c subunit